MLNFRAVRTRVIGLSVAGLLSFLAYCSGHLHAQPLEGNYPEFVVRYARQLENPDRIGISVIKLYHPATRACWLVLDGYREKTMAPAPSEVCK
jgi:hypothetical protein